MNKFLKEYASIYAFLLIFCILAEPFLFGKIPEPYTPITWLLDTLITLPIIFILLNQND